MAGHADPQVFPEHAAAQILGVQVRRLRAWRDLVAPSITRQLSQRNTPAMYTFDEMLQLRVVVELTRRGIAIATVRRLVEHLRLHVSAPLAELVWATEGSAVFTQFPDGSWSGGAQPDQLVLRQVLNLEPLRGELRRALLRGPDQEGQIVTLRRVHGRRPVFAGTRIPVATIQRLAAEGLTDDEIMEEYPRLTASDLLAVRAG